MGIGPDFAFFLFLEALLFLQVALYILWRAIMERSSSLKRDIMSAFPLRWVVVVRGYNQYGGGHPAKAVGPFDSFDEALEFCHRHKRLAEGRGEDIRYFRELMELLPTGGQDLE